MARKTRKGYFVDGEFVTAGSAADQQYRIERKGTDAPSRTELKDASERLQALGEQLLTLRADLFNGLSLPEKLREAIVDARRITSLQALRRQKQFIGKLMHRLNADELAAVSAALDLQHAQSAQDTLLLHKAEEWRDALIADDSRLGEWLEAFPGTDVQQLRALIRQSRREAKAGRPDESHRQGKTHRQIFSLVREQLNSSAGSPS